MAEPFVGEIRLFGFKFAPTGWVKCDGATMPINQNPALYSLLGVQFGGDGKTNFGLPDLRGRIPLCFSADYPMGLKGGVESATLNINTIPFHSHLAFGTNENGDAFKPGSTKSLATSPSADDPVYITPISSEKLLPMNMGVISPTGSGVAHNNIQPCLVINFCIATSGYYPPRQ